MIDWHDPTELPTPETVLAGMPRLIGETHQIVEQAERLAARMRIHMMKMGAVLAALSGQPIHPAPATRTTLGVELHNALWNALEAAISRLQAAHPGMGIDGCLNDIFEAGIARINGAPDHDLTGQ